MTFQEYSIPSPFQKMLCILLLAVLIQGTNTSRTPRGIEIVNCPQSTVKNIICARFNVPLDYHHPEAEQLSLWFAIINGTIEDHKPQAFTIIPGGPGVSAFGFFLVLLQKIPHEVLQQPLVLLDTRGTGFSQRLVCSPFGNTSDPSETYKCGRDLGPRRIHFTSANRARDLEMLRKKLSISQWNMMGVSYGTQVVRYSASFFPKSARTFIMDGAYKGEERISAENSLFKEFRRVLTAFCERSSKCSGDELLSNLDTVLKSLRQNPRKTLKPSSLARSLVPIIQTPLILADPGTYSEALRQAKKGNFTQLEQSILEYQTIAAQSLASLPDYFYSNALLLATTCVEYGLSWDADETDQLRKVEKQILDLNPKDFHPFLPSEFLQVISSDFACLGWPRLPLGVNYREIVPRLEGVINTQGRPVLVLNGEFDLATTETEGRRAAAQFDNVRFAKIANTGHVIISLSECGRRLIADFVVTGKFPDTSRCADPSSQPLAP